MRLLYILIFLITFGFVGVSSAVATGPRDCDMDGTPCETYSDPYWDKPTTESPPSGVGGGAAPVSSAPVSTAPRQSAQAVEPATPATAPVVAQATVPESATPVNEAAQAEQVQVASSQSLPREGTGASYPAILLLLMSSALVVTLGWRLAR